VVVVVVEEKVGALSQATRRPHTLEQPLTVGLTPASCNQTLHCCYHLALGTTGAKRRGVFKLRWRSCGVRVGVIAP